MLAKEEAKATIAGNVTVKPKESDKLDETILQIKSRLASREASSEREPLHQAVPEQSFVANSTASISFLNDPPSIIESRLKSSNSNHRKPLV